MTLRKGMVLVCYILLSSCAALETVYFCVSDSTPHFKPFCPENIREATK